MKVISMIVTNLINSFDTGSPFSSPNNTGHHVWQNDIASHTEQRHSARTQNEMPRHILRNPYSEHAYDYSSQQESEKGLSEEY
jgi:hypothetical protein